MRLMDLARTDPEVAAVMPDESAFRAIQQPGLSYVDVIARTLAAYDGRPALGMRAYELVRDEATGRTSRRYLPRFETITYGEVARRIEAIAAAWRHHPDHRVEPGEFVALIAFASTGMVLADLACAYAHAIAVPLQANLPPDDMAAILTTTAPAAIIANVENLAAATRCALAQETVRSLVVIDADPAIDDEREAIAAAVADLAAAGGRVTLATLEDLVAYGTSLAWTPLPPRPEGPDALSLLMHTSGSTGTPKGAMIHEAMCVGLWAGLPLARPTIHVVSAPMNHFMGRAMVYGALAQGGKACFTLHSDMSTLFEDIRIVRPTAMMFFPRIAEIVYQSWQAEVQRRIAAGADPVTADAEVRAAMAAGFLGDRLCSAGVASSPTAPEVQDFLRQCFGLALIDGYSSTEAGTGAITVDGWVQRSLVIAYKLLDVPELGYYGSDRPYPRGELLLKSRLAIKGYYKRPDATAAIFDEEGWLHTGDIVEEREADRVVWIGRRNNVIKLSQAEYVALGPLEATYLAHSPLIAQIFIYGNSQRSYLLAAVVPDLAVATSRLGKQPGRDDLRAMVLAELQEVARTAHLRSFEVPRDVLIELEPFSHENGLLSSVRKPLHPKLKERFGPRLEAMYGEMERTRQQELVRLRSGAAGLSRVERVAAALKASLGLGEIDPEGEESFADLGGDSLGAVSLSLLLEEMFEVNVPVSVLLDPSASARRIARYIDNAGKDGAFPKFAAVHGEETKALRASDLVLDAFLGGTVLANATRAAPPADVARTVLMTGATGFLGRFLCLEWMEALVPRGGRLICTVRAADAASARARLAEAFGTHDPALAARFERLAAQCLEVLPADLAMPRLGLDEAGFARLAREVDQIVHPGALVNHLLSYRNLFEPNVAGTAELIRLALSERLKRFEYVSTFGVPQMHPALAAAGEDADVRHVAPETPLSDSYAAGYGASKWAGEVLLREAHEHFGLPVTVYRPDLIMAHSRYRGQLNLPDMFTRLIVSLALTGIAPVSFYEAVPDGGPVRVHYDGMPVDFLAAAIRQNGERPWPGFRTFNTISSHRDDGISLDTITGWLESGGIALTRIADHPDWFHRFADRLRHLPDAERQASALPILAYVEHPLPAAPVLVRNKNFVGLVRDLAAGPEVPGLSEGYIHKYLDDLRALGLLP